MMTVKIRLIDPISERSLLQHTRKELKTLWFPHLSLTTVAAMTPADIDVAITDENVESIDFEEESDLVGLTGMTIHASRAYAIARSFRERGVPVVMGGPHASALPEEAKEHVDAVVIGEAEDVWSEVLADAACGSLKPFYRADGYCSMDHARPPRRELLKQGAYMTANCLQTSRGCPFKCDFCYVTNFFGNTYRCKALHNVIKEVEALPDDLIVFVDDNITGDREYAKNLFAALAPLRRRWAGQSSLTIARDDELLRLAAESGCVSLFIGIESLSPENLRSVHKTFNKVAEYEDSLKKIHDHGIMVLAGLIFGFEYDDEGVFERTVRFVERTKIEAPCFFILTPLPGTPFFTRMDREDRILHRNWSHYTGADVVFRPKLMTEETLQKGFNWACREAYSYSSIFKRLVHPQHRFFTRIATNLALRQAARRQPKARLPMGARIVDMLNTSFPVRDYRSLMPTLRYAAETGQRAAKNISHTLNVHVTRNERLNTLFVRLEGSLDTGSAEQFLTRIKDTLAGVQDKLVIDFNEIHFLSHKALHLIFVANRARLAQWRERFCVMNLADQIPDLSDSLKQSILELEVS